MIDVEYLIGYNSELDGPVIISTRPPYHTCKVLFFTTYETFVNFHLSNNFISTYSIPGYFITLAYNGSIGTNIVDVSFDFKDDFERILNGMGDFFTKERIQKHPRNHEKYIFLQ